jgi:hypothetical protein
MSQHPQGPRSATEQFVHVQGHTAGDGVDMGWPAYGCKGLMEKLGRRR